MIRAAPIAAGPYRAHRQRDNDRSAGVPGRQDLDDAQELNYPPIMRALVEVGYKGFIGHEFIPRGPDQPRALEQAVQLCTV